MLTRSAEHANFKLAHAQRKGVNMALGTGRR